jgi:hypothetical protein
MTKLTLGFHNFSNEPKKVLNYEMIEICHRIERFQNLNDLTANA